MWNCWESSLAPQVRIPWASLSILSWYMQQDFLLVLALVWYLSRLLTKSCLANIFQIQIRPKFLLSWLQIKLIWDECSFMSMMAFHSQNHRHLEVEEIINYLLLSSVSHVGNSGPEKVKVHRKSYREIIETNVSVHLRCSPQSVSHSQGGICSVLMTSGQTRCSVLDKD